MLVSGGKVIAIDNIKTNSATLSGDGIWSELGLNTSAVIDPINNKISSLSSDVNTISGNLNVVSGDVTTLKTDVNTISSDLSNVSSKLLETSGKLDTEIQERKDDVSALSGAISAEIEARKEADNTISAALDSEIETRQNQVNDLSAAIDENSDNIFIVSSYADSISAGLDEETEARLYDVEVLDGKIEALSSYLDEETLERIEADEYLSAAIDTKQHILSAGDNILITSGDEYDTISVTGLKTTTYFATPFNRHTYSEYFDFNINELSANSAVGYFNLCIGYKVNTNGTNVDNYYSACIKVNNEIVDTHYINGGIPSENHYISKNVLNDSEDNLYTITIEKDNGINISDMNITCVGYIGETDPISLGVLGTNGAILTFGNTVLRV